MVKKKFKSTVLCCAFHPQNGQLLATGAADFKCRVYSTFDSSVDDGPNAGPFASPLEFGEAYCELTAGGWVTAVAWSPSGSTLAFAGLSPSVVSSSSTHLSHSSRLDHPLCDLHWWRQVQPASGQAPRPAPDCYYLHLRASCRCLWTRFQPDDLCQQWDELVLLRSFRKTPRES
jgi:hypothetical protein